MTVLPRACGVCLGIAAFRSVASKIGCNAETLRGRVRQHERDRGERPGPTSEERERLRKLERDPEKLSIKRKRLKALVNPQCRAEILAG